MMAQSSYIVALDLGGTRVRICVATDTNHLLKEWSSKLPVLSDARAEIQWIVERVDCLIAKLNLAREQISHLSFATAALVEKANGIVVAWPNRPYWNDLPLADILAEAFPTNICIERDTHAAAYGELTHGRGMGYQSLAYVTISTGIGCGLILGGQLYRGVRGLAGNFGHTIMVIDGPNCSCGKSGCLQALASGRAIANRWLALMSESASRSNAIHSSSLLPLISDAELRGVVDAEFVARQAAAGNWQALQIFRDAANLIAVGIANLVNLLDLELVIIGGGVTNAGDIFIRPLRERVAGELADLKSRNVEIAMASLGDKAGLIGALALALA